MFALPWGIILLLPLAWLLFRNKGRYLAQVCGHSRQGMLWWLFLILLASFFTFSAGILHLNAGALLTFVLAGRLLLKSNRTERLRALLAAGGCGLYAYAFVVGTFWWLARLSFPTDWLLPLLAAFIGFLLAGSLRAAIPGIILGLTLALAGAGYHLSGGLTWELGSFSTLNSLLISLFIAGGCSYLKSKRVRTHRPVRKKLAENR